ncbi:hypothetical protein J6590_048297 [Homalodisca vitripennis]|nr:hypothetical protein J6590_048297 [Homalodisca vitripennis]
MDHFKWYHTMRTALHSSTERTYRIALYINNHSRVLFSGTPTGQSSLCLCPGLLSTSTITVECCLVGHPLASHRSVSVQDCSLHQQSQ